KFIADKYGEKKLGDILYKGKRYITMNKALKESIGVDEKEFWEEFSKEMKRRYWPDIATRMEVNEIAKQLTNARKDGSYFNEKPVFAPDGERIAIFTDRWDYEEIVMISAEDGKVLERMVKGSKSADLESLHSYVSGMSFSPDGSKMVFVAKSKGEDALMFYDVDKNNIYKRKKFKFHNILSPDWSPDGKRIVLTALKQNKRDVFVYEIDSDKLIQLTDDRFDDIDPTWCDDSRGLIFSSDRPHPLNPDPDSLVETNVYVHHDVLMPGGFQYGYYNLFRLDSDSRELLPLKTGAGQNKEPEISPDGDKVAFISNRNGIENIYIAYLDSADADGNLKNYAVTDILTGIQSISWSPNGKKLAFEAFHRGAFDVFVLNEIIPAGEHGTLASTAFMKSEYDLLEKDKTRISYVDDRGDAQEDSTALTQASAMKNEYETFKVEPESLAVADSADTAAATDSAGVAAKEEEEREKDVVTETGIHDGDFVFVSNESKDALDSLMLDVHPDSEQVRPLGEPAKFDSIAVPPPGQDYTVKDYKTKFTPDYIGGGVGYDTFFGLRGQTFFVFSDYLGNHQIFLATDLVNTIDQSNIQAYYLYNQMRTSFGTGIFHTKNFYLDESDHLFSDRFYGFEFFARRPFSVFSRFDFTVSQYFIDREYYDFDDPRSDRSSKVTTGQLSWIFDNIVWGVTGPLNGRRMRIDAEAGINLFDANDIEFYSGELDFRKYWHFGKGYSFALRATGGASTGETPKLYFLGGTTNWIGNRTLDAKVYEVENLYFADVVTPLRGIEYYELSGDRFGLVNLEFRYPLIEYFVLRFPITMVLRQVQGAIFMDVGSAWFGNEFKGGTSAGGHSRLNDIKTGFGFGMRANLGIFVLRYDLAWRTDFNTIGDKSRSYFSFGADF
ncbi:MAG: hypothetical protein ACREBV_00305, partial [Candidatus Zixiibacteriota bacterium]